jgi:hypothetical protein
MVGHMSAENSFLQSIIDKTRNTSSKDWVYKSKVSIVSTLVGKEIELAIEAKSIHHTISKCDNESSHDHLG